MKQVRNVIHYTCRDTLPDRFQGQGITIAVLDTGIVWHPDFDTRIIAFKDMLHGKKKLYDDNGHGTHIAGILAGSGVMSRGTYTGMAPKSKLVVVKVLDEKGDGNIKEVVEGLGWILRNQRKYNIRVVNISVGTLPHVGNKEEAELLKAVEKVWDAGMVVVTAAGNYGPERGTITTPGDSPKVITVGSSDDRYVRDAKGRHKRSYSGRGPTKDCVCKPDLVAPGSYITSCNSLYYQKNQKPYVVKSGTSMSTPIVAGVIAVLLSKYPDMGNVEVKLRLRETCDDLQLPKCQQGWGRINVGRLLLIGLIGT